MLLWCTLIPAVLSPPVLCPSVGQLQPDPCPADHWDHIVQLLSVVGLLRGFGSLQWGCGSWGPVRNMSPARLGAFV